MFNTGGESLKRQRVLVSARGLPLVGCRARVMARVVLVGYFNVKGYETREADEGDSLGKSGTIHTLGLAHD